MKVVCKLQKKKEAGGRAQRGVGTLGVNCDGASRSGGRPGRKPGRWGERGKYSRSGMSCFSQTIGCGERLPLCRKRGVAELSVLSQTQRGREIPSGVDPGEENPARYVSVRKKDWGGGIA